MKYKITRESLENARKLVMELENMHLEINRTYDTYHSPVLSQTRSRTKGRISDPTANALHKREKLREMYEQKEKSLKEFERYVKSKIEDPFIFMQIQTKYFFNIELPLKRDRLANTAKINKYLRENEARLNADI